MTPNKKSSFKGPLDTISSKPDWSPGFGSRVERQCGRVCFVDRSLVLHELLEHGVGRHLRGLLLSQLEGICFYWPRARSLLNQYAGEWDGRHCTTIDFSCKGAKKEEECSFIICMDCMIRSEGYHILVHWKDTYHWSSVKLLDIIIIRRLVS